MTRVSRTAYSRCCRFVSWSFFGVAMELYWVVGVFLLVWLALAVVCVRKGRAGWIVLAIFLPIPLTIVASLVAGIIVRPQQTGGLGDFSRAFAAMGVAAGIGVVSSYIVLAVGATRPRADPTRTHRDIAAMAAKTPIRSSMSPALSGWANPWLDGSR